MRSSNDGSDEAAKVFAVAALGLLLFFVLYVVKSTRASFISVTHASAWSLAILVTAGAAIYFSGGFYLALILTGVLPILWPIWWPVLDSAACGACDSSGRDFMPWNETYWWSEWYTKAGFELLFLGLFAFMLFDRLNNPHRYY